MIRAVLDTNVLLSALRSKRGASHEILERLLRHEWRMVVSTHLLFEYEEILKKNADVIGLTFDGVDAFLNALALLADGYELPESVPPRLPDADDEPLLRLAEASGVRVITTHNLRHLRVARTLGVAVLLPRDFLGILQTTP